MLKPSSRMQRDKHVLLPADLTAAAVSNQHPPVWHPASEQGMFRRVKALGISEGLTRTVELSREAVQAVQKHRGLPQRHLLLAASTQPAQLSQGLSWKWKGIFEVSCAEYFNLIIWSICNNSIANLIFIYVVLFANC